MHYFVHHTISGSKVIDQNIQYPWGEEGRFQSSAWPYKTTNHKEWLLFKCLRSLMCVYYYSRSIDSTLVYNCQSHLELLATY